MDRADDAGLVMERVGHGAVIRRRDELGVGVGDQELLAVLGLLEAVEEAEPLHPPAEEGEVALLVLDDVLLRGVALDQAQLEVGAVGEPALGQHRRDDVGDRLLVEAARAPSQRRQPEARDEVRLVEAVAPIDLHLHQLDLTEHAVQASGAEADLARGRQEVLDDLGRETTLDVALEGELELVEGRERLEPAHLGQVEVTRLQAGAGGLEDQRVVELGGHLVLNPCR